MSTTPAPKQRQRITIDLEALFPGEPLMIGDQQVLIRPLVAEQIAILTIKAKGYGTVLADQGVTWDNYNQPENLFTMATVLIKQFPEVLEELSDIHKDDLIKLPIDVIVTVIDKVIEVNLKAKENFEKNSKSLTTLFRPLIDQKAAKQESPQQSKS